MSDKPQGGNRLNLAAGVVGLATAVLGLVGAGVAMLRDDGDPTPAAAALASAPVPAIDQSGLDRPVPPVIDGYMSGPAFLDLWAAQPVCYGWQASDKTCLVISRLTQRGPREIRAREEHVARLTYPVYDALQAIIVRDMEAQGRPQPLAYWRVDFPDYRITAEGICSTNEMKARSAGLIQIAAATDETFQDATPLSASALAAFRQAAAEQDRNSSIGGAVCWRFKRAADDPTGIDQHYFIDGVPQPDQTIRLRITPEPDVSLRLFG